MDLVDVSLDIMFEGKLFFAPVEQPHYIVDIGTGTGKMIQVSVLYTLTCAGIWAMKVGDSLPSASGSNTQKR